MLGDYSEYQVLCPAGNFISLHMRNLDDDKRQTDIESEGSGPRARVNAKL